MGDASATLLSWIAAEVDQALARVRESIARFLADPGDLAALASCPEHLHQVGGALRMVGLAGATRFCDAIEEAFARSAGSRPSAAAVGAIDRAVLALKDYVDGLERGQADVPLRLFPAYRDLVGLHGDTPAAEKDLFFPDLDVQGPAHPEARALAAEERASYLQARRAQFQRGLLALLRGQGGIEEMRQALDDMHRVAAELPEPKSLWWAAGALVEALVEASDDAWLAAARPLCNKLDFQIRDLATGAGTVNEALLRELLYAVAKSGSSAARARDVRHRFRLDGLWPGEPITGVVEFDLDWLQPALDDARTRLEALKAMWLQYVAGDAKSAARFRELVASFRSKAAELGNPHLVKLLDAITLVATRLPDPYPAQGQLLVIEMASAFLLAESVIESFTDPAADLEQQIGIMGGWLLDAAQGKSAGEPPAGLRADLSERIGALQLRAQVSREISATLQHVERALDSFARGAADRDSLAALSPYLRQIHGALDVLGFGGAARILPLCEKLIEACAHPGHDGGADLDWVAEGLSSVGFFLDPCLQGREPAQEAVELFFRRYDKAHTPAEAQAFDSTVVLPAARLHESAAPAPATTPQTPPAPSRPAVNAELLAVYLEEADEVLAAIRGALPACRAQPQDREALTAIRRGFHTLKGSGRMVGLMDLGEVAWEIEQVMNLWLEQQRPATAALLELIDMAAESFSAWVSRLREGGLPGEVDARAIAAKARALKDETDTDASVAEPAVALVPPASAPEPARLAEAPPAPEVVDVDGVRLPVAFFEIYMREAAEHASTLEAQCAAWRKSPGAEAPAEFVRAAHTLASSSRTAGFPQVAALAEALEHWMPLARHTGAADAGMVQVAVANLRAMAEALARREPPPAAPTLVQGLRELMARLRAAAAAPAPRPPQGERSREQRRVHDDIDSQLLPVFLEEAGQLLPQIGGDLRDWKASPEDSHVLQSLQRALHTLKGSARMAGAIRLGELTHLMESRIEAAAEGGTVDAALFAELEEKLDRLSFDLERMAAGPAPEAGPEARAEPPLPSPAAMLRINADTLDHLINASGEVSIARSRIESELHAMRQSVGDLREALGRMREQLREIEVQADSQMQSRVSQLEERKREFDPLEFDRYTRLQELTRLMAESLHDAASIQQGLLKNFGESDAALLQQSRLSRDVQQALMRMRAVPFSVLDARLYRIVRQTARELGKQAELEIEGSRVELDRSVLERIGAPIEHMLRNALVHGLESPEARRAAGKPEGGRLRVSLRQEANEIVLVVGDDGAGLDLARLRAKAAAEGQIAPDAAAGPTELAQLIFVSGLSTATEVTELAGRGVGMDVVKNEIGAIGGRVEVHTAPGEGTTFTVTLPLTLAVTQAALVRSADRVLAVPTTLVEQLLRVKADALAEHYQAGSVPFQERDYPLHSLASLLGGAPSTPSPGHQSVLLLRSGLQRMALHVDELLGNREIVVKSVGPQLARVTGVTGATVLADGRVVLIANPVTLAQRARNAPERTAAPQAAPELPVVMVVDDSLTVRKVTARLLEREGYRVLTAKDGVDALEQMREELPAVLLVDIEMPRMDGFDLARQVRGDDRLREVPIIVITSRTAEKHRAQAAQLGVNAFFGKPYPEAELLQHIQRFVAVRSDAAIAA